MIGAVEWQRKFLIAPGHWPWRRRSVARDTSPSSLLYFPPRCVGLPNVSELTAIGFAAVLIKKGESELCK